MTMCKLDYPERWESLFSHDIPNALNSQNDKGILTGLQALQCLTKKFEFELDEGRDPLYNIMQQINPVLGGIIETYMQKLQDPAALTILQQIIKIFYNAN